MAAKKKSPSRRERIDTGSNSLFVRRSITADKRQKAKRKVPSGQGDRGDR